MRLVREKTKKYLAYKKKTFPTVKERYFIRGFERAYALLNLFDRNFFFKVYVEGGDKDWWKDDYPRHVYCRMRRNISRKFLNHLYKYEK